VKKPGASQSGTEWEKALALADTLSVKLIVILLSTETLIAPFAGVVLLTAGAVSDGLAVANVKE
jgi:hypothetical protein